MKQDPKESPWTREDVTSMLTVYLLVIREMDRFNAAALSEGYETFSEDTMATFKKIEAQAKVLGLLD